MKRQKSATFAKKFKHKQTNDKNYCKVQDHCHHICKYRDSAHSTCSLKYTISKERAVFFTVDINMTFILS